MLRENGRNSEGYVCPLLTRLRQPGDHSGVRQRSPDDQFDRRCIVTDLETMLALSVIQNEVKPRPTSTHGGSLRRRC